SPPRSTQPAPAEQINHRLNLRIGPFDALAKTPDLQRCLSVTADFVFGGLADLGGPFEIVGGRHQSHALFNGESANRPAITHHLLNAPTAISWRTSFDGWCRF